MAWPAKGGKSSAPAAFAGKKGAGPFKGATTNGKGPATFRASESAGKDGGLFRSSLKGAGGGDAKGSFRREAPASPAPKGLLGKGSVFTRPDGRLQGCGGPAPGGTIRAGGKKGGDFAPSKGLPRGVGSEPLREAPAAGYNAAFGAAQRQSVGFKGQGPPADRFDAKGFSGKKGPVSSGFKGAPPAGIQQPPPPVNKGGEKGKRPRLSPADRIQSGEPVHTGVVRSFNPDKKNGFIDCQSMQQYGSSVYVFQDVLERALPIKAGPGDRVAFFIHWSPKGQPQASSPLIKLKAGLEEGSYALKGIFKSGKEGSFGFIECQPTREFFGRDVYVNKDLAAGLESGQLVCFNVYLNRDSMPNAEGLELCDEFWEPPEGDLSMMIEVDTGKGKGGKANDGGGVGKGKGKLPPGKISGPGSNSQPESTGEFATGVVKSFNVATNYGFITSPEVHGKYGSDVFVHGREYNEAGLKVGDPVTFEVATNSRGQPQAINIMLDANPGAEEPPAKRQRTEEPMLDGMGEMLGIEDAGFESDYAMPYEPEELPQEEGLDNFSFSEMLNANDGSYE